MLQLRALTVDVHSVTATDIWERSNGQFLHCPDFALPKKNANTGLHQAVVAQQGSGVVGDKGSVVRLRGSLDFLHIANKMLPYESKLYMLNRNEKLRREKDQNSS